MESEECRDTPCDVGRGTCCDGSDATPLVQSIKAVGLTPVELKAAIEMRLKEVIDKPNVTVLLEPINVERR